MPDFHGCTKIVQKWGWSRFSRSHILPPMGFTGAGGVVYTGGGPFFAGVYAYLEWPSCRRLYFLGFRFAEVEYRRHLRTACSPKTLSSIHDQIESLANAGRNGMRYVSVQLPSN